MADIKDKCTIIGPTIAIRGKVKADEDLVIRGRIYASISSTKLVHIDKDGVVKANVEAESILISGVVVTETIFNIAGVGRLIVDSVLARDYPVVQGTILFFSFAYILVNLLIDVLYVLLDPRIRY